MNSVAISPNLVFKVEFIGLEQTPVIIIDDFAVQASDIIADACHRAEFSRDTQSFYPGCRAALPRQYIIATIQATYLKICDIYNIPALLQLQPQASYYSLLTLAANELSLPQRVPHFDTSRPYFFAVLHYLDSREHGATGFFREKHTNYERISDARVDSYLRVTNDYIKQAGEPPLEYFTRSSAQYELYHQIEYKPNRVVVYPGNLLHSTLVHPDTDISKNPNTGRLTANVFIDFQ